MEYYKKTLSPMEAKRHFIYVTHSARKFFPPLCEVFHILINNKEFKVQLDKQGRIWAASLQDYIAFESLNIFVFTKIEKNKFKLVRAHY